MKLVITSKSIQLWRGQRVVFYPRTDHTIALVWSIALACGLQLTFLSSNTVVFQEFLV